MTRKPDTLSPERWMAILFDARAARRGGVIRRRVQDVEQSVGREAFLREVERRGYQVVENGRQFVVFCNRAAIRRVWSSAFTTSH